MLKISIITATYNRANVVLDAIKSVQSQVYKNIEHIFIDGASVDATYSIISRNLMPNSISISEPDGGIYFALNKGIKIATGEIIGIMHSDDIYADKNVLADVAKYFENPKINIVYGDLEYVSKSDNSRIIRKWRPGFFKREKLSLGWMPPHPTVFVRKSIFDRFGYFDTAFRISSDYDFMLRIFSENSIRLEYIPRVLIKMRVGGESNASLKKIITKSREDWMIMKKNGYSFFSSTRMLLIKNLSKIGQLFNNN
ncbi:glycosyltransferase [Polynucleobacter paneuropaeus]|nr:glycosyltransferase [Polynucleobacter paneuropaeus]MBT8533715.1 glycosyltransferase [Polynucleobacter paneuropaeus]